MTMHQQTKQKLIPKKYIYWLDYTIEYTDKARITAATALSADGRRLVWQGVDCLADIFQTLCNNGAAVVYVWNMEEFGGFCDYYALKNNYPHYDTVEKGKAGVKEPCYNILYAAQQGVLMFRLTQRRTKKTHNYGCGSLGGLHTVEYRGMSPFFRGRTFEETLTDLNITGADIPEKGINLYNAFIDTYAELTGESLENVYTLRNVYTIGGAARRVYLKIKYGTPSLSKYQAEFFQDERGDDFFRQRRLLLSGMCFFPESNRGVYFDKPLKKYDVNGLYTYISNQVGALGYPLKSDYTEFKRDKSGKFAYILVVKNVMLCRRRNMPNCFSNPFTHESGNIIEFDEGEQWAVFGELWNALDKFYMKEEFEIIEVFKCEKIADSAIIEYNEKFLNSKVAAKAEGNRTKYLISKLFLNCLLGKMVQNNKYRTITPYYDEKEDSIFFNNGDLIDNWERGHFHYLRGAYIYVMARVKVMTDIYNLMCTTDNPQAHHFYTDTDSIITDLELPESMISDTELGKYKIEEVYDGFGVIAPKTYYGHTVFNNHNLTAAGIKKHIVINDILNTYGELNGAEFWQALKAQTTYNMPIVSRVRGGCAVINTAVRIGEFDIKNLL